MMLDLYRALKWAIDEGKNQGVLREIIDDDYAATGGTEARRERIKEIDEHIRPAINGDFEQITKVHTAAIRVLGMLDAEQTIHPE